jgi:hypothetical protein
MGGWRVTDLLRCRPLHSARIVSLKTYWMLRPLVLDIPIVTITEMKVLVGESYPRLDDSDSLDRFQRERSDENGA